MRAATLTVGSVRAGAAENVIPARAGAGATVRALDEDDQGRLRRAAADVAGHIAAAHGCTAALTFPKSEPALVNDPRLTAPPARPRSRRASRSP